MKYAIIYDKHNRLRIRFGADSFTNKQGYVISDKLLKKVEVISAKVSYINGGVLVYYKQGYREDILSFFSELKKSDLDDVIQESMEKSIEIDNNFIKTLGKIVVRHYLIKFLAPIPIRKILTLYKAMKYVKLGLSSFFDGELNVEVLDMTSILVSISQGSYSTASSVMTLLEISSSLEEYTRKKTRNALTQSLALNIDKVWLRREDGEEVQVPVSKIEIGDKVLVRAGSVIPFDGEVVEGEALVNESSMTGEPLVVLRAKGNSVFAGTALEEGNFCIKVRVLANESRIQKIASLIDTSESLKANVQSKAERLADRIVPFSFLTSILTYAFSRNLTKAISVLMVDYSCALKLSTPICVISAMLDGSNHEIMVKGGKFLEAYSIADTIVFDKTGTLTRALPKVSKVIPFDDYSREEVLKITACLEEHFPHSIAKAIVHQAEVEKLDHKEEHAEVQYILAHGISSMLYDKKVLVGSAHFVFDDEGVTISDEEKKIIEKETLGCSTIYLAIGGKIAGVICIEDTVRSDAKDVIKDLKDLGLKRLIMLTGDGEAAAKSVCDSLGITEYYAQVLPEEKAKIVQDLKNEGNTIVMVGDGINDSPALACADVAVSIKDGSDIAKEVADIALLSNNLYGLVSLRLLSKRMMDRINSNYGFIIGFNSLLIAGGIAGILAPSQSALFHNISTMAISGLSMRPYLD